MPFLPCGQMLDALPHSLLHPVRLETMMMGSCGHNKLSWSKAGVAVFALSPFSLQHLRTLTYWRLGHVSHVYRFAFSVLFVLLLIGNHVSRRCQIASEGAENCMFDNFDAVISESMFGGPSSQCMLRCAWLLASQTLLNWCMRIAVACMQLTNSQW